MGLPEGERWGNDGLVTLQSARWGEYLGTLEENDHWSLRGSKGREVDVELASVSGSNTATPMTSSMGGNGSGVREGDRGSGGAGGSAGWGSGGSGGAGGSGAWGSGGAGAGDDPYGTGASSSNFQGGRDYLDI